MIDKFVLEDGLGMLDWGCHVHNLGFQDLKYIYMKNKTTLIFLKIFAWLRGLMQLNELILKFATGNNINVTYYHCLALLCLY